MLLAPKPGAMGSAVSGRRERATLSYLCWLYMQCKLKGAEKLPSRFALSIFKMLVQFHPPRVLIAKHSHVPLLHFFTSSLYVIFLSFLSGVKQNRVFQATLKLLFKQKLFWQFASGAWIKSGTGPGVSPHQEPSGFMPDGRKGRVATILPWLCRGLVAAGMAQHHPAALGLPPGSARGREGRAVQVPSSPPGSAKDTKCYFCVYRAVCMCSCVPPVFSLIFIF